CAERPRHGRDCCDSWRIRRDDLDEAAPRPQTIGRGARIGPRDYLGSRPAEHASCQDVNTTTAGSMHAQEPLDCQKTNRELGFGERPVASCYFHSKRCVTPWLATSNSTALVHAGTS